MSSPPSLIWCLAWASIAKTLEVHALPKGRSKARVGRWRLIFNNTSERDVEEKLSAFCIIGRDEESRASFVVGPFGGATAGYDEAKLITDLLKYVSPEVAALYADDIKAFEEQRNRRK